MSQQPSAQSQRAHTPFICPTGRRSYEGGCAVHGDGRGQCGPTVARDALSTPAPADLPRCCPTCLRPWKPHLTKANP